MMSNTLCTNDFFAGLSVEAREELAWDKQTVRVPAGTKLAECGEPADHLVILNSGQARIHVLVGKRKVPLGMAGPGTVFGLHSMLAEAPLDRGLTCVKECEVTLLPRRAFLEVLNRNPQMYFAVVKALSADLAGADRIIRNYARMTAGKARYHMESATVT
jgi:CRP-like cAMP-binding protein